MYFSAQKCVEKFGTWCYIKVWHALLEAGPWVSVPPLPRL